MQYAKTRISELSYSTLLNFEMKFGAHKTEFRRLPKINLTRFKSYFPKRNFWKKNFETIQQEIISSSDSLPINYFQIIAF